MIDAIAHFYVFVLEPALKVLAVVALIMAVLYVLNLLRGGDRKGDLITTVVNGFFKVLYKSIVLLGIALAAFLKMLLRNSRLLFATLRDFFKSDI